MNKNKIQILNDKIMNRFFTFLSSKIRWHKSLILGLAALTCSLSSQAQIGPFVQGVTVLPPPTVSIVEREVCLYDTITILFSGRAPFKFATTPANLLGLPTLFDNYTAGAHPLTVLSGPDAKGVIYYSAKFQVKQAGLFIFDNIVIIDSVNCVNLPTKDTLLVRPLPTIAPLVHSVFCNGERYWGNNLGDWPNEYTWTNIGDNIGLDTTGAGDIPAFTIVDSTRNTLTAQYVITATRVYDQVTCYAYDTLLISANPTPEVDAVSNIAICNYEALKVVFDGNADHYRWTKISGDNIPGLANNGLDSMDVAAVNSPSGGILSAVYEVVPEFDYQVGVCQGNSITFTISVYPEVYMTSSHDTLFIASGETFVYTATSNLSGTFFLWDDVANTADATVSELLNNSNNIIEYRTYRVAMSAGSCTATDSIVVGVIPGLQVSVTDQYVCANESATNSYLNSGTAFDAVISTNMTATITDTIYTLTGVTTDTIHGSLAGITFNYGVTNVQMTIIIGGNIQVTDNFTVTVNALPALTLNSETHCAGATVPAHVFGTGLATYSWTSTAVNIGASESGTGILPGFVAVNTTAAALIDTFYVTATIVNPHVTCAVTDTFTITVNPLPIVTQINDTILCNNGSLEITFGGNIATGVTYNWRRVSGDAIGGLAYSGTGNINTTVTNSGNATQTAIYEVIPVTNVGCTGAAITFSITVIPTIYMTSSHDTLMINSGETFSYTATSNFSGASFLWDDAAATATATVSEMRTNTTTAIEYHTYRVTLNGGSGCTATDSIVVGVVPQVQIALSASDIYICSTGAYTVPDNADDVTVTTTATYSLTYFLSGVTVDTVPNTLQGAVFNIGTTNVLAVVTVGSVQRTAQFTVTIGEMPALTLSNEVYCAGERVNEHLFGTGTDIYSWTSTSANIGAVESGTGVMPTFIAVNSGTTAIVDSFIVTATSYIAPNVTCNTIDTFTITVNPLPAVNPVSDTVLCSSETLTINFAGNMTGTTYNWRRISGYAITPASMGTNTITATPVNTSGSPVSAVYEVTPLSAEGCTGASVTFTITVNPELTITPQADLNYCAGSSAPALIFNGNVAAATYAWEKLSGDVISGLPTLGNGNMPSFFTTNSTDDTLTATYTVTMTYTNDGVSCATADTFDISVYPVPTVTEPAADFVLCHNDTLKLHFAGTATEFTWHKIGGDIIAAIPASGVGDTNICNVTVSGNLPVTALYEVTPVYSYATGNCSGVSFTFAVTVNPIITMTSAHADTITSGDILSYTATSNAVGVAVNWTSSAAYVSGSAGAGTNALINETLINTTNVPQIITYYFTFELNNCTLTDSLIVTVNPLSGFFPTADQYVCVPPNGNGYTVPDALWDVVMTNPDAMDTVYYVLTGVTNTAVGNTLQGVVFDYGLTDVTWTAVDTFGAILTHSFSVTVYTLPVLTLQDETYCAGATVPAQIFGTGVTVYTWTRGGDDIGLALNSGTGLIPAFTATAAGVDTFYVVAANNNPAINCVVHDTLIITIKALPTVNAVADVILCSNEKVDVHFGGSAVANTVYHYQLISGNAIQGLLLSGNDSITGTAINTAAIPLSAVYQVTPEANGCTGTPINFHITINPELQINATEDISLCTGATAPVINFNGNVSGATYAWTKIAGDVIAGLPASGNGSIPSFFAVNSTTNTLTATYKVTMNYTNEGINCAIADTFDITVYPMPTLTYPNADTVLCNGDALNIVFTGAADSYSWRKLSGNILPGLAANGTGNINTTLTNAGNTPLTALYEVIPAFNFATGICQGVPVTFTITVNPTPVLTSHSAGDTICSGDLFAYTATSNVPGATFTWSRAAITEINNGVAGSGTTAAISEILNNSSTAAVTVLYQYNIDINGCGSASATSQVSVVVLPVTQAVFAARYNVCANAAEVVLDYTSTFTDLTYLLLFDMESQDAGFISVVTPAVLPADGIHVAVPAGVLAGNYHATIIIDSKGCQTEYAVTIHVIPLPQIVAQPQSLTMLCPGQSQLEFSVQAIGEDLSYQWYFNGTAILGATDATYSVLYDSTMAGSYYVMVMAVCDTLSSEEVTATNNTITINDKWTDVLYVDNNQDIYTAYQWYKDGNPVVNNGQSQYYAEQPYLQGSYRVRIQLADGTWIESCDYAFDNSRMLFDNLYPNPAEGGMEITVELFSELSVLSNSVCELYDVLGRRLTVLPFSGNTFKIKAPTAAGTYHLRIINNEAGVINKRFIVQ
jgi:hypothetical protein